MFVYYFIDNIIVLIVEFLLLHCMTIHFGMGSIYGLILKYNFIKIKWILLKTLQHMSTKNIIT